MQNISNIKTIKLELHFYTSRVLELHKLHKNLHKLCILYISNLCTNFAQDRKILLANSETVTNYHPWTAGTFTH